MVQNQLEYINFLRSDLEKDMAIEKNWRTELHNELEEKNSQLKTANEKLETLEHTEQV